jgi:hypothetical protein
LNDWKEAFRWCCCVCYFDGVAVAAVGQSPDIFRFSFFCFVVLFRLSADNDTASETMENWAVVPFFFLFSFSHEMRVSLHSCVCVSCIFYPSVKRARESFAYRLSSPDSFSPRHNADTSERLSARKLEADGRAFRVSWTTFGVTQRVV